MPLRPKRKIVRTEEENDALLILGRELRTCTLCGEQTFWLRPRQRTGGCCPTCVGWFPDGLGVGWAAGAAG